jgi:hypothetical protein
MCGTREGQGGNMSRTKWIVLGGVIGAAALGIAAVLAAQYSRIQRSEMTQAADYWPTEGWKTSTPEEQGMDSGKLAEGLLAIRQANLPIHSLLAVRNGRIVLDAYFYPYDGSALHNMRSDTTTLVAIAADQGKLSLDQPMDSFFPDVVVSYPDPRRDAITVQNLTIMANGLESMGFAEDEGTLNQMYTSDDYMRFALDRPMASQPGTKFVYDSPGMHILSGVIQSATGLPEKEYAQQVLFDPLGITDLIWPADAQGHTHGWGDLHLRPRDAAKIGFLWLQGGQWDGQQIVPADWVKATSQTQIVTGEDDSYSYGWWYSEESNSIMAQGRGGQDIRVEPNFNAVVVMTGAGIDYDYVSPYLRAAVGDLEHPLPPNREGVAKLEAALEQIKQAPAPQTPPPLPDIADSVSGQTYSIEPNPVGVKTVRLTFVDPASARIQATFDNGDDPLDEPIGLDGTFQFFSGEFGLPAAGRGHWSDANTFIWERELVSAGEAYTYVIRFEGERVAIQGTERSHAAVQSFEGVLANP